ncbi:hypothetical protein SDRG_09202 [Saprolegnia diclina VS20]|uniref:MI domain-containing protein n=1 Tax=Saprolegnia diclina (strain VS20) TaxID=1156394 RepID=T0RLM9_SAPDV|nr:hypothetical protein SDRG_09202 [Saprolegnia diclina VS20]EQC33218.1 hypothetical protein SDRG_09202 [Saprolegnia diclina VS20]|eukprot:XP_008613341.1 hypothetical protein SDRG_09202 [Saprolegnia diclina VS20]
MAANRPKFKSSLAASLATDGNEKDHAPSGRGKSSGRDRPAKQPSMDEHDAPKTHEARTKKRMVYAPKKDVTKEATPSEAPPTKFRSSLMASVDTVTEPKAVAVASEPSPPAKTPFKSSLIVAAGNDDSSAPKTHRHDEKTYREAKPRFKSSLHATLQEAEAKPARNDGPRSSFKKRDVSIERQPRDRTVTLERQSSQASSHDGKKPSILSRVGPKHTSTDDPRGLSRSSSRSSMDDAPPREARRDRSNSGKRDSDSSRRNIESHAPPPPAPLARKTSFESRGPALHRQASAGPAVQRPAQAPSPEVRKVTLTRTVTDEQPQYATLRERLQARGAMSVEKPRSSFAASSFDKPRSVEKPRGESLSEKEKRTNDYYAKLQKETAPKPSAPVFKSSLMQSMKSSLSSSLALSIAREPTKPLEKMRYSYLELLSYKREYPKPADLTADMTVITMPASPRALARSAKGSFASRDRSSLRRGTASQRPSASHGNNAGNGRRERERDYGGKKGGKGRRGGRDVAPPPLLDGPYEPFVKSEKRWVPSKEKVVVIDDSVAATVKTLLNKLTRELFEKLTLSFCEIPLTSFGVLRTIVRMIMEKALDEPNFAEVYADLCARLHAHTLANGAYKFLHPVQHATSKSWLWTAISSPSFPPFYGPYESVDACVAAPPSSDPPVAVDELNVPSFYCNDTHLFAICTKRAGAGYFVSAKTRDSLTEDELLLGNFPSADAAMKAAVKCTTFKRLLVTRCQDEFDKWNVADKTVAPTTEEEKHRAALVAKRAKARMLGNMRFIGELFKVELLAENVVQTCLLKLLGLRLVTTETQGIALQTLRMPDEEELEALCKMLATVGKKFDHDGVKTVMNGIIVRLVELSETPSLPSRTRFLLKDLLETRDYQWVPRRKELQQKTLDEVRKEAEKLQRLGKNAQHDDLVGKRKKTANSSEKLAKQNSTLLLRAPAPLSPAAASSRIKGIVKEYLASHDLDETRACLRELPRDVHVSFIDTALTYALEGKDHERSAAVDMLASLYETLDLGATEMQSALLNTLEFLDDLRIDIPMVHESLAAVLGRLILAGCFGLSWLQSVVGHLVDSGLAGLLLAEVLSVIEEETSLESVVAMIAREELSVVAFLPDGASVDAFLKEQEIDMYFYDDEEDEDDEELWARLTPIVDEYLVVGDIAEVETCLHELAAHEKLHMTLVKLVLNMLCECKSSQRAQLVTVLRDLHGRGTLPTADLQAALAWWLVSIFEDVEIDVPQAASYVAPVPAFLVAAGAIPLAWLTTTLRPLVESGLAAKLVQATCAEIETSLGHEATVALVQASAVALKDVATLPAHVDKVAPWFA